MEQSEQLACLKAENAQLKAQLHYERACTDAAERRLLALEHSRKQGFHHSTLTKFSARSVSQTPTKGSRTPTYLPSGLGHMSTPESAVYEHDQTATHPYNTPVRGVAQEAQRVPLMDLGAAQSQDIDSANGLTHELKTHAAISPALMETLQRLWCHYTEATDKVINGALSKAQTEDVCQTLEVLRSELRIGSVYPTQELASVPPTASHLHTHNNNSHNNNAHKNDAHSSSRGSMADELQQQLNACYHHAQQCSSMQHSSRGSNAASVESLHSSAAGSEGSQQGSSSVCRGIEGWAGQGYIAACIYNSLLVYSDSESDSESEKGEKIEGDWGQGLKSNYRELLRAERRAAAAAAAVRAYQGMGDQLRRERANGMHHKVETGSSVCHNTRGADCPERLHISGLSDTETVAPTTPARQHELPVSEAAPSTFPQYQQQPSFSMYLINENKTEQQDGQQEQQEQWQQCVSGPLGLLRTLLAGRDEAQLRSQLASTFVMQHRLTSNPFGSHSPFPFPDPTSLSPRSRQHHTPHNEHNHSQSRKGSLFPASTHHPKLPSRVQQAEHQHDLPQAAEVGTPVGNDMPAKQQQATSRDLGIFAAHHLALPHMPHIKDGAKAGEALMQKTLQSALAAAERAYEIQERRQRSSSWARSHNGLVLFEI